MSRLYVNERGLSLIKRFEGFKSNWYLCPANVRTIGYGHTGPLPSGFSAPLTEAEGEQLLIERLRREFKPGVRNNVNVPLTNNQFSALVSFVYNVGVGAFRRSTMLRLLNQGDYNGAADQFLRWVNANGRVFEGLVRRRTAERNLFLEPDPSAQQVDNGQAEQWFSEVLDSIDYNPMPREIEPIPLESIRFQVPSLAEMIGKYPK